MTPIELVDIIFAVVIAIFAAITLVYLNRMFNNLEKALDAFVKFWREKDDKTN